MVRPEFGVYVPIFCGGPWLYRDFPLYKEIDWKLTEKFATLCETLDFDSLWVIDHLIYGRAPILECWTILTYLAAMTQRIRIGVMVLCNLHRLPQLTAKMSSTLDYLSNGRLEFGYGAGWNESEFKAYGIPFPEASVRIDQMREGLDIIKKMWTEERPSYHGKYYTIDEAVCEPKPIQKPHPRIWIGGGGKKILRLAAEYGDCWNCGLWPPRVIADKMGDLKEACSEVGRRFEEIKKSWHGAVFISNDKAFLKDASKRWSSMVHPDREPWLKNISQRDKIDPLELVILGTPNECIRSLEQYVDVGITHFVLLFNDFPSFDGAGLFAKEVIPSFK